MPSEIRTGCISWTYPDWLGPFYPKESKPADYLRLYSSVFDIVEVDSTFYRSPNSTTVKQWKERTPENFLFTVKMPQKITHILRLQNVDRELEYFENTVKTLAGKLACFMTQLPPNMKFEKGYPALKQFLSVADKNKIRYAFEFRSESWLRDETYDLLKERDACLVWSVSGHVENLPPIVTTDFLYLRFMGEFKDLTKFDRVQKDRTALLENWHGKLKDAIKSSHVERVYVLSSNHFAGFAPATTNQFRKIAGMDEKDWKEKMNLDSLGSLS